MGIDWKPLMKTLMIIGVGYVAAQLLYLAFIFMVYTH